MKIQNPYTQAALQVLQEMDKKPSGPQASLALVQAYAAIAQAGELERLTLFLSQMETKIRDIESHLEAIDLTLSFISGDLQDKR